MTKPAYDDLITRLGNAGLDASYVRAMMPDWLSHAAEQTETGLLELKLLLARRFGLDADALLSGTPEIFFSLPSTPRFKRTIRVSDHDLTAAASIAAAVTRIVTSAMSRPYTPPGDAASIRKFVFAQGGKWISLRGLLQYCLYHGIPVIPLRQLPDGMPKMDGMIVWLTDRPAVVIGKSTPYKAWYSFILAHELGHLHANDVQKDEMLVDDDFQAVLSESKERDDDEVAADRFAINVLSGDSAPVSEHFLNSTGRPKVLARAALEIGEQRQIDPGHLLLRFAYESNRWQQSIAALQVLDNNFEAFSDLVQALFWSFDAELLSAENTEFLLKVTELGPPAGTRDVDSDR